MTEWFDCGDTCERALCADCLATREDLFEIALRPGRGRGKATHWLDEEGIRND